MGKVLPVWVFLLCLLLGALFTMMFGWSVKSTLEGSSRSGSFGKAAVAIASFPTLVNTVFTDVRVDLVSPEDLSRVPRTGTDLSGFAPIRSKPGIDVKGLVMRTDTAQYQVPRGWRILVGAFSIGDKVRNAAIAISPDFEISHVWVLTEGVVEGSEPRPQHRKLVHGFVILNDASVIFSFDGGVSLQRHDQCGVRIWATPGSFHHTITLADGGDFVWTMQGRNLVKVATATGEIARRITMQDIIDANPAIDILEIRRSYETGYADNVRNDPGVWLTDPVHLNDVEPLPAALADRFDGFEAGDLLVSARSLNLVFVLDPDTLEVKWWSMGNTRRQHDPDWGPMGEITVFDNRMSRDYSRIVSLVPGTRQVKVLFDGSRHDFYSRIRGSHQITAAGELLVTSPQQGRVLEVAPDGEVVLEILNTDLTNSEFNYVVSRAFWLPADALDSVGEMPCKN